MNHKLYVNRFYFTVYTLKYHKSGPYDMFHISIKHVDINSIILFPTLIEKKNNAQSVSE